MSDYRQHAKILQAIAHPVRLQILEILERGPACVCDLVLQTSRRQAYISQHLMLLRGSGLVTSVRFGNSMQYELVQPEITKNILKCVLQEHASKNPNPGKRKMSNASNNGSWHGIPREKIQWHPSLVADRCNGCGLCATSCDNGVFAFDYEANRPVVVAPEMCTVGCTICSVICSQDALEFPSPGYIRQVIRKNKLMTQSKDTLQANHEQYDVRRREPVSG